jgi:hypothetical protein
MTAYQIQYTLDGKLHHKTYDAPNPGEAFAKCLIDNPGATLIHATRRGRLANLAQVEINYDPPPVQRPITKRIRRSKSPTDEELVFPFFPACCSKRPIV